MSIRVNRQGRSSTKKALDLRPFSAGIVEQRFRLRTLFADPVVGLLTAKLLHVIVLVDERTRGIQTLGGGGRP
jgi:acetylglutamate synthase